jgi:predicted nucleic acid-binding protein
LKPGVFLIGRLGSGIDARLEDAAIAATAVIHDLTVVTSNIRHFQNFNVPFMVP